MQTLKRKGLRGGYVLVNARFRCNIFILFYLLEHVFSPRLYVLIQGGWSALLIVFRSSLEASKFQNFYSIISLFSTEVEAYICVHVVESC